MRAVEEFVGRQEREVHAGAFVCIDAPPAERLIDARLEPPPRRRRHARARRAEPLVERGGEGGGLAGDESAGMIDERGDLRRRLIDARRQGQHRPPAICGGCRLAQPLVEFGEADERHEVPLVASERRLQRGALAGIVALHPPRLGEVHP